jgi:hypothetical protein
MSAPEATDAMPGPVAVHVIEMTPAAAAALQALGESLGLDVVRIDLAGCADKAGLLARTAEALAFPAWFGGNWDAFFDCLADLGWRSGAGHVLVFEHTEDMRRLAPEALDTAVAVLGDAAAAWDRRGLPFRVFLSA